jgi:tetratricopeptide (TPR) repeat protein
MQLKSCQTLIRVSLLATIVLSGCLTGYLEENAARMDTQMKQQNAEIEQQRRELEALRAGRPLQDQKQEACNRAYRDYFDKAQLSTNRDQGIDLYRQGLAICPDDDVAHYELGRALVNAGRYGEAEREFEAALKVNPGFADAKNQLDLVRSRK